MKCPLPPCSHTARTTQPLIPAQVPRTLKRSSWLCLACALLRLHDVYLFAGLSQPLRFISRPLHLARLGAITGKCPITFEWMNEVSSNTTPPHSQHPSLVTVTPTTHPAITFHYWSPPDGTVTPEVHSVCWIHWATRNSSPPQVTCGCVSSMPLKKKGLKMKINQHPCENKPSDLSSALWSRRLRMKTKNACWACAQCWWELHVHPLTSSRQQPCAGHTTSCLPCCIFSSTQDALHSLNARAPGSLSFSPTLLLS